MSIAVSVIVGPSRIHRLLLGGCGLAQSGAALAVGLVAPGRFPWTPWLALLPALAAAVLLCAAAQRVKTHRIDISGTGDLRVTVQQGVGIARADAAAGRVAQPPIQQPMHQARQQPMQQPMGLLPGSSVWAVLALLRYTAPDGSVRTLPVWRDSVDPAAWRALSVALIALGRRVDDGAGIGKIR